MKGLEGEEQNIDTWQEKPVKMLKNRSDMFAGRGIGNDKGHWISDQLEFMSELVWRTRADRDAAIDEGCIQSMCKNDSAGFCN